MCNPALESVNDLIYEGEVLSSKEKDFSICALSFSLIKSWRWKSFNNLKTYEVTTLKSYPYTLLYLIVGLLSFSNPYTSFSIQLEILCYQLKVFKQVKSLSPR